MNETVLFWTAFFGIGAGIFLFQRWRNGQEAAKRVREQAERDRRAKEDDELMTSANLLRARVLWTYQMGTVNLEPNLSMSLRVEAPDGAYDVQLEQPIAYTALHRFSKGSMIDVCVDPKNREHVVLCDPDFADMLRDAHKPSRE